MIGANTGLKIGSNELLKSAIHKSLTYAITELGLPEFSQVRFTREISPLLRNPLSTIEDSEATRVKLGNPRCVVRSSPQRSGTTIRWCCTFEVLSGGP